MKPCSVCWSSHLEKEHSFLSQYIFYNSCSPSVVSPTMTLYRDNVLCRNSDKRGDSCKYSCSNLCTQNVFWLNKTNMIMASIVSLQVEGHSYLIKKKIPFHLNAALCCRTLQKGKRKAVVGKPRREWLNPTLRYTSKKISTGSCSSEKALELEKISKRQMMR